LAKLAAQKIVVAAVRIAFLEPRLKTYTGLLPVRNPARLLPLGWEANGDSLLNEIHVFNPHIRNLGYPQAALLADCHRERDTGVPASVEHFPSKPEFVIAQGTRLGWLAVYTVYRGYDWIWKQATFLCDLPVEEHLE
jgi:hypothetical protein